MSAYPSDLDIARAATLRPMEEIGAKLGLAADELEPYGRTKAKVPLSVQARLAGKPHGKLILVTAVSPTPAGEGKTTTTVGLGDGLNRLGKQTTICLREPSLGPCFGMKGGAAGGGKAQVVPMEDINLHFTGDFHAITSAHNLLAAALDNHMHHGNKLGLDPRRISWTRVLDLNERALRDIVTGLGGLGNSVPRETGFEITAASEVMAVLALATDLQDLKARLGRLRVGLTYDRKPVTAADLNMHGAMTALLRDALAPNLVQTLEGNPAFVHAGPFGNIAHGCNSVVATRMSLGLSDYTVTEAGFGADLGAEKFFDIKCRVAGLKPDATVLVATVRALKHQGGAALKDLGEEDADALAAGIDHMEKHVENLRRYRVPLVVCVNAFVTDRPQEIATLLAAGERLGVPVVRSDHWARGGEGALELAQAVIDAVEGGSADFQPLYPDDLGLLEKTRRIAQEIYGADDIVAEPKLVKAFKKLEDEGHGALPICMAKTQYSFSTDPKLLGRPRGFDVPLRAVTLKAGAGFVLVLTGDILTMPGLPKIPSAEAMDVDAEGRIAGLF
ncbi:MAG: formate--tetrahydrofolate ligase [Planctomycetota bacterium]|nr:MAG: formate--tetrahydrofolate ligase [Planctomycetota bacterium]